MYSTIQYSELTLLEMQESSTLQEEANRVQWWTQNMHYNVHYIVFAGRIFMQYGFHGENLFRRLSSKTQEEQQTWLAEVDAWDLNMQARALYGEELFADPPPWLLPVWDGNEEHYRQRVRAGEYEALRQRQEEAYKQSDEYKALERLRAEWARMDEELRQRQEAGELAEARPAERITQPTLF